MVSTSLNLIAAIGLAALVIILVNVVDGTVCVVKGPARPLRFAIVTTFVLGVTLGCIGLTRESTAWLFVAGSLLLAQALVFGLRLLVHASTETARPNPNERATTDIHPR